MDPLTSSPSQRSKPFVGIARFIAVMVILLFVLGPTRFGPLLFFVLWIVIIVSVIVFYGKIGRALIVMVRSGKSGSPDTQAFIRTVVGNVNRFYTMDDKRVEEQVGPSSSVDGTLGNQSPLGSIQQPPPPPLPGMLSLGVNPSQEFDASEGALKAVIVLLVIGFGVVVYWFFIR